jgi:hypothetical protein
MPNAQQPNYAAVIGPGTDTLTCTHDDTIRDFARGSRRYGPWSGG